MKKFVKIALLVVLSLSVLSGCKDATATISDKSTVIMTIGKTKITKGDVYDAMCNDDAANIIVTKALALIAEKEVELTDDIKKAAEDIYTNYKEQIEKNKQDFEETIKSYGYESLEAFMDYCTETARSNALTDKYIEDNWNTILEEYAPVKARIISISGVSDDAAAKEKIQSALAEIKDGGDFEAVAAKFSDNKDLGKEALYTRKSSLDYNVLQYLSTVNAPGLSDIITSQKGTTYYIVQVTNINAEQLKDELIKSLKDTNDFVNGIYTHYCEKHNFKIYDIGLYNLIKNNYPAFLVQK